MKPTKRAFRLHFQAVEYGLENPVLRELHSILKNGGRFRGFESFKKTGK